MFEKRTPCNNNNEPINVRPKFLRNPTAVHHLSCLCRTLTAVSFYYLPAKMFPSDFAYLAIFLSTMNVRL